MDWTVIGPAMQTRPFVGRRSVDNGQEFNRLLVHSAPVKQNRPMNMAIFRDRRIVRNSNYRGLEHSDRSLASIDVFASFESPPVFSLQITTGQS